MLDALPGLSRIDLRQLDHEVTPDAVIGGVAGYVFAGLLNTPVQILARTVAATWGTHAGTVALVVGKLAAVYVAVVVIVNWRQWDRGE